MGFVTNIWRAVRRSFAMQPVAAVYPLADCDSAAVSMLAVAEGVEL